MNFTEARQLVVGLLEDVRDEVQADLRAMFGDADAPICDPHLSPIPALCDVDAVVTRVFDVAVDGSLSLLPRIDRPQIVEIARQHARPQNPTDPTDLPCPEWCDLPTGHPFDRYDNSLRRDHERHPDAQQGELRRHHEHRLGDRINTVSLRLTERATRPTGGVSDLRMDPAALLVVMRLSRGMEFLTGDGARRLSAQLLAAADLYDAERAAIDGQSERKGSTS